MALSGSLIMLPPIPGKEKNTLGQPPNTMNTTFDPSKFTAPTVSQREMMLDISKLHPLAPLMQWQVRQSPPQPTESHPAHIAGRGRDVKGCIYFWVIGDTVHGNVYYEVTPKELTELRRLGEFPEGVEPDSVFTEEYLEGWGREILNSIALV